MVSVWTDDYIFWFEDEPPFTKKNYTSYELGLLNSKAFVTFSTNNNQNMFLKVPKRNPGAMYTKLYRDRFLNKVLQDEQR